MKLKLLILSLFILINYLASAQVGQGTDRGILFRGQTMDASTMQPISNSQILVNSEFASLTGEDGTFSLYVSRYDTVVFRSLGYKPSVMFVSDTLTGREYVAGIYMNSDTVSIGEVIIVPGFRNLRSSILNPVSHEPENMSNARYNVAIAAYQGKHSQNVLGDPQSNYAVLNQKQKTEAFERGGIPSDQIAGINPLILIPAAYMLMHGSSEKAAPMHQEVTPGEMEEVHKKYLESIRQHK
jgi:hypothetical protein